MFEIICISKVISAGYMTDINSHAELLAPSRSPRAASTRVCTLHGDAPAAPGELKVNGIMAF